MSDKKILKNKNTVMQRIRKSLIPSLLIGSGVLSIVGLGGFIHHNRNYTNIQAEIDQKVGEIISTAEYATYKNEREKYFYELYKGGNISSDQFDENIESLTTASHIIENDVPVSDEDKQTLADLEAKKLKQSLGVLGSTVAFVGLGTVAFAGGSAYLDNKDKDNEMSD